MKRANKNHIKVSTGERIFRVANYTFLTLLAFVCLYPMWHVLMASFSSSSDLMAHQGLLLKPLNFTLECYERVFKNKYIWSGYLNTLKWLALGVPFSMFMTILAAYFFSRRGVLFRRPLMILVVFTMFFSGGMIPKVDCCIEAIHHGVKKVIIMDGRIPHAILMELLTDEGAGTMVTEEKEFER